jgi:1-deoxy-D-xylulose-5-phosphate synthase
VLLDKINSPSDLKQFNFDQLYQLCKELSGFYIKSMSGIGGHLGGSLGVLELTVALHYVFNTPKDKLIWDVGHQAHIHKILTGRRDKITTLKQEEGLSGFTKRCESVYDPFGAGHSSTSISAALGIEVANILEQKNNRAIAVIGDGALGAGMAYEAINNAGSFENRLIVILNDNKMSISPSVGALNNHLAEISAHSDIYHNLRYSFKASIPDSPVKQMVKRTVKTIEKNFKQENIFENLGFDYLGPVDGHNLESLINVLEKVKNSEIPKPVLIHVLTEKGRGFYSTTGEHENFHAVAPFCLETRIQTKLQPQAISYTKSFADRLIEEAKKDSKIVAITAAMSSGTGLDEFQKKLPDRFFDVGIAEQHAVTFAAGLACEGMKPFVAIYSTFLQRAYDQVVHDVAIQNLPVRFALDRAGLVGDDGATHAGSFDLTYLSTLPNFVVMAPSDENILAQMVSTATRYDYGPIAFRYPRGNGVGVNIESPYILPIGKGRIILEGNNIAVISVGTRLGETMKAAKILKENHNINITVVDAMFIKPIDKDLIKQVVKNHNTIITVEENSIGGFASQFNNFVLNNDLHRNRNIKNLHLPDVFLDHGKMNKIYEIANLNASAIVKNVLSSLNISTISNFTKVI